MMPRIPILLLEGGKMTKLNIYEDIYGAEELEVLMGETQIIIPMQERMCPSGFIFKLANSELVVGGAMSGVDYPKDEDSVNRPVNQASREQTWRRSKDGGKSWYRTPPWPSYGVYQFPYGEIACLSGRWWQIEASRRCVYSVVLFRSIDDGYTFKKERVPLYGIPKLAKVKCQHSDKERYANINHQMVALRRGNLLASAQGKFESDVKERTFIIESANQGKTWTYLSTVAFDLTENGVRPLGFDEPNLLVLPNNDILCFMRSGSRRGGALYMSRSKDNGRTWSHADPIADRGVYPTACLMRNGVIAVVYGRPGDWLTFSLDEGKTWINHFCFNQTPEPNDCGNYDWIEEVVPDKLLVIYSRTDPNNCMISEIMGTYFKVKPRRSRKRKK